jgi:tRNA modification GTPase
VHDLSTTLAAVATAPGRGGIGCVRISGPDAYAIAQGLFHARRAFVLPGDGRPRFATFLDGDGAEIDHGYIVAFGPERAYTGEPTVELWPHGSPPVLDALTRAAVVRGAKPAGPGEFTYRALRRGRLDLARAEAVRDLIAARTVYQARIAFTQVEGALARRLAPLREALIDLVARGEAAIEFADEAETHLGAAVLAEGLAAALASARSLLDDANLGRIVREGARVALSGVTSVGKSSVFNRLLGRDRAIVSAVPGTTRDTLEETIELDGVPVTVIDTAGVRAAGDAIEAEGVRRARAATGEADLVVLVLDASRTVRDDERAALAERFSVGRAETIVVANKIDLAPQGGTGLPWPSAIPISALTGDGFDELQDAIRGVLRGTGSREDPVLTNVRHAAALAETVSALERARQALPLGVEIVLEELRAALASLAGITGDVANEDLYDRIFSTFCIGK